MHTKESSDLKLVNKTVTHRLTHQKEVFLFQIVFLIQNLIFKSKTKQQCTVECPAEMPACESYCAASEDAPLT